MDKTIIYEITANDTKEKSIIKIATTGFPITEKIEYQEENTWSSKPVTENNIKLDEILEDNNIRLIMDVMQQHDKYYINNYNTTIEVVNAEIVDDYIE